MEGTVTESKLAKALAKAQQEFPPVKKDRTANVPTKSGGKYSYNYADLSSILAAVTPVLNQNELALSQLPHFDAEKLCFSLVTRLMHSSGESIEGSYPLPTAASAQEMGSAITYARRYSVQSILGISTEEDDDGASAAPIDGKRHASAKPKPEPVKEPEGESITGAQAKVLRNIIAEAGITNADAGAEIRRVCGVEVKSLAAIPATRFDAVKAALEKAKPGAAA